MTSPPSRKPPASYGSRRQSTRAALGLSLITIRTRWVSFAGAFAALAGGVAIIVPMLLTLAAALQTPFPGPQRFAGAPVVITPPHSFILPSDGYPVQLQLTQPRPLPATTVARLAAAGRAVPDRTFAVQVLGGPSGESGHPWSAAALGRYRLTAGRAPARNGQIVVAAASAALVGRHVKVATPDGVRFYQVSGVVAPRWSENAVFFTDQASAQLRMAGATPRQMRRMIVGEAALLGLVAPVPGALAGAFGGHLVAAYLVRSGNAPGWFTVGFAWWPVAAGYGAGLTSALLGSTVSAWRAGRVAPVGALRDAAVDTGVMTPLRWLLGCAALACGLYFAVTTISGSPFELANLRKVVEIPLLIVAAFALLLPILPTPMARWLTWPLGRLGPGGTIVRASAIAAGRRTAATATAVVVATGVAAAFFVLQDNANSALTYQAAQTGRAQFFVVPASTGGTVPAAAVAALRKVPGARVVPVSLDLIYVGTRGGQFIDGFSAQAVPPGALPGVEHPAVLSGSLRSFGASSLIVDHRAEMSDGLHAGQAVAVWGPDGARHDATIAAIVRTGLAGDLAYVSTSAVDPAGPSRVDVGIAPGANAAQIGPALRQATAGQPVAVISRAQEIAAQRAATHKQSRTTTFLVIGIALAYSLIAVANTMVMASSGRRRELAALNLSGATRRQVLGYVAAESLVVAILGAVVSLLAGACVMAVQRIALADLIGDFPLSVPWQQTGVVAGACAVIGVLAATITSAQSMHGRVVELAGLRD